MDWWQAGSVMGTVVLATTAVATFGWRVLRQETDKLRQETDKLRQQSDTLRRESREAHDRIGERITQVQVGLSTEIGQLRDGQASLREGIGEVRGELKGVRLLIETLRGDFRAHVFGRQD